MSTPDVGEMLARFPPEERRAIFNEAMEQLFGELPPLVEGERLYLVVMTERSGRRTYWRRQHVLAQWVQERERGSPLPLTVAEGLAATWEGAALEPWCRPGCTIADPEHGGDCCRLTEAERGEALHTLLDAGATDAELEAGMAAASAAGWRRP